VFVLPEALYRYRYHAASSTMRDRTADDVEATAVHRQPVAGGWAGGWAGESPENGSLLAADVDVVPPRPVLQDTPLYRAAYCVWAGGRPGAAVLRSVRGGSPGSAGRSLLYGVWGNASPTSLRLALGAWIRVRDRSAGRRLGQGPYEWHFASSS
jgi:hypothetical protein